MAALLHLLLSVGLLLCSGSTSPVRRITTPKVEVKMLNYTEDMRLLQCDVRGPLPNPVVQWRDWNENVLPAEEVLTTDRDDYHITLQATVNQTGYYMCTVLQKETGILSQVGLSGFWGDFNPDDFLVDRGYGFRIFKIVGIVLGVVCVVLLAFLIHRYFIKKRNTGSTTYSEAEREDK